MLQKSPSILAHPPSLGNSRMAARELWHGTRTGDADSSAALIAASQLVIGVDGGPLHVAGATATPTIGVRTQHHPVHFSGSDEPRRDRVQQGTGRGVNGKV